MVSDLVDNLGFRPAHGVVFDLLEPETHSPEVFRKRGRVHREVLGRNEVMEGRAGFLLEAGFDQCLVLGRELANR